MQPKLVKLTFLKQEDQLIGTPWTEYPHWIRGDSISMLFTDKTSGHSILMIGNVQFHVKESIDEIASRVNGQMATSDTKVIKYHGKDVNVKEK